MRRRTGSMGRLAGGFGLVAAAATALAGPAGATTTPTTDDVTAATADQPAPTSAGSTPDGATPDGSASWNRIAVVGGPADGAAFVVHVDADGSRVGEFDLPGDDAAPTGATSGPLFVASGSTEVVDLRDGTSRPLPDLADGAPTAVPLRSSGGPMLFVGSRDGRDGVVVTDTEIIEIGEAIGLDDPFVPSVGVLSTPDGSVVAVSDLASRTVTLVSVTDGAATPLGPGFAMAPASDGFVIGTGADADGAGDIVIVDAAGVEQQRATPTADVTVVSASPDGDLVAVIADGEVVAAPPGGAELMAVRTIATPAASRLWQSAADGSLAIDTVEGIVVLGPDGQVRGELPGAGLSPWVVRSGPDARCATVQMDGQVGLLDMTTGELIGEWVPGQVAQQTDVRDGCAAVVTAPDAPLPSVVLTDDGVVELGPDDRVLAIDPDGGTIVFGRFDDSLGHATTWMVSTADTVESAVQLDIDAASVVTFIDV